MGSTIAGGPTQLLDDRRTDAGGRTFETLESLSHASLCPPASHQLPRRQSLRTEDSPRLIRESGYGAYLGRFNRAPPLDSCAPFV